MRTRLDLGAGEYAGLLVVALLAGAAGQLLIGPEGALGLLLLVLSMPIVLALVAKLALFAAFRASALGPRGQTLQDRASARGDDGQREENRRTGWGEPRSGR